jgi:hypothetical protein
MTLVEIPSYNPNQKAFTRSTKTNSEGTFLIPDILPGAYNFKLTLDGFRPKAGTLSLSVKHSSLQLQPEPQLPCQCSGK